MNCPNTGETVKEKHEFVAKQTAEAVKTGRVTIRGCGTIPVWAAYRCLYCGEYFNQTGAEQHFGATRDKYFEHKKRFKRPTRCQCTEYDEVQHKRVQCRNRKNLKRITLVTGWGLPRSQRTYYRRYYCPQCRSGLKSEPK